MDRFLAFYKTGLSYILELNREGVDIQEVYAKILLTKILTPYSTGYVDLQSPAGAGVSVLVYNYNVYATDESRMLAEMQDETFLLGNVHRDTYESIYRSELFGRLIAAGRMEILKHLFSLLASGGKELTRIFFGWIRDQSLQEMRAAMPV